MDQAQPTTGKVSYKDLWIPGPGDSHYYEYPGTGELFPSASSVTGGTSDSPWLAPWGSKVSAVYSAANVNMLLRLYRQARREAMEQLLTATTGGLMPPAEIRRRARAAGEAAVTAVVKKEATRIRNLKRDVGSYVHAVAEAMVYQSTSPDDVAGMIEIPALPEHLAGCMYDDDPVEDVAAWMVDGFRNFVADWKPQFLAAEMAVYNRDLKVAGTLDLILGFTGYAMGGDGLLYPAPGQPWNVCTDIKTGKHTDNTWAEQITAYRHMTECNAGFDDLRPMPLTHSGAVLHLRPEFKDGYRFMPIARGDDNRAWNRFRRALELWTDRQDAGDKPGKPAYPLRDDGTLPPRRCVDLFAEGYGRAPSALAKAGVGDLEDLAALAEDGLLDLPGIGDKTIPVIRRILADHGLHMAGDDPALVSSHTRKA